MAFLPVVIVDDPSKHVSPLDRTLSGSYLFMGWYWHLLTNTLMWPPVVVVFNILHEHSTQVPRTNDEQLIQALSLTVLTHLSENAFALGDL